MPSGLAAVPPAQLPSAYRDVIKLALRPRQTRAFILSAISWHLLLTSALLKTISLSLLSPLTLSVSVLSFGVGVLPLLARRKRNLSSITTPPPAKVAASRAQQLSSALADPTVGKGAYQHVAAFVVLALGYAVLLTAGKGGWGLQVWVDSHGSFYLNERFLFLVGQSVVLGGVYGVLRGLPSAERGAAPSFDPTTLAEAKVSIKDRVVSGIASRVPRAAAAAAVTSVLCIVAYSMVRIRLWSALLLVIGTRGVLRRVLVPSFRVDFNYVEVSLRSTLFSIAATCAVETAYLLLDVYLTHPLPAVCKLAKNPNRLLLDGLDEPIWFFSNHAFGEVARLAREDGESRKGVYKDVNGADGTAWMRVRERCLRVMREEREFVVRRGEPPKEGVAKQVVQQQQKAGVQQTQTIWDQLAAGPTGSTATQTQTQASTPANKPPPPPSTSTAPPAPLLSKQTLTKAVVSLARLGWNVVPSDAKHVLFGARRQQYLLGTSPSTLVHSLLGRDSYRLVSCVSTLCNLLCHSLAEDPYGTVQKDIKRVLEAMVDLDYEIRRLGVELEGKAKEVDEKLAKLVKEGGGRGGGEEQEELRKAWKESGAEQVDHVLTTSIREVLDTFGRFELGLGEELEVKLGECLS